MRELLSPAGGHLQVMPSEQTVQLRVRRDADLCVVFAQGSGGLRPLPKARTAQRPLARRTGVRGLLPSDAVPAGDV